MARFGEFCACRANFVPLWQSTTRAGRTLYRIQGGCGVSRHNRTPSATGVEGAGVSGGPVCGAHGRWRAWPGFETTHRATHQQPSATVWRPPEGPEGLAAVPVGGGGAWPGFETTRRAKLAARTASGRAPPTGAQSSPAQQGTPSNPAQQGTPSSPAQQATGYTKGAGTEVPAPCRFTQPLPRRGLRPDDRQSWRRRRIHRNMPPTTAAPRPAPPIRPSKPVRARPFFGLVAGTSGAT